MIHLAHFPDLTNLCIKKVIPTVNASSRSFKSHFTKGSLNHPKKGTKNCQDSVELYDFEFKLWNPKMEVWKMVFLLKMTYPLEISPFKSFNKALFLGRGRLGGVG